MKTRMFIVLSLMFASTFVWSQTFNNNESNLLNKGEYSFMDRSPLFGMTMGSSFTTGFAGSSLFTQSVAPHLTLRPGQNFSLVVGSVFSTGSFGGSSPVGMYSGAGAPDRMFSTTVYALGAYQVNPRLVITGGAWTERNNMDQMMFGPQMNPQAFDMNPRGMMMGMEYRITENLRFGAEVSVSQGYNPFNPYNTMGRHNNNPFRSRNPMFFD